MALTHNLAGLISAAFVVLALQLVANPALAHAGHDHSVPATSSSASRLDHHQTSESAEQPAIEPDLAAVDHQDQPTPAPSTGCTGGCCGVGMSCCGAVLPVSASGSPDLSGLAAVLATVCDQLAGIDPDALTRPPKSLA
jgi:hypothetical protein